MAYSPKCPAGAAFLVILHLAIAVPWLPASDAAPPLTPVVQPPASHPVTSLLLAAPGADKPIAKSDAPTSSTHKTEGSTKPKDEPSTSTARAASAPGLPPVQIDAPSSSMAPDRVDINRAGVEDFIMVVGLDRTRAEFIVSYRESHGPFQSLSDLKDVQGISDSVFDRVAPRLYLAPRATPAPFTAPAPRLADTILPPSGNGRGR